LDTLSADFNAPKLTPAGRADGVEGVEGSKATVDVDLNFDFDFDFGDGDFAKEEVSGSGLKDTAFAPRLPRLLEEVDCGPSAFTTGVRASC
jgi:hypothetical protein